MKTEVNVIRETENVLRCCLADIPFLEIEDIQVEPRTSSGRPDILAKLRMPTGEVTIVLEVRSNGQPRFAREAVMQIERMTREIPNAYGVFAAPYISPRSADICIQRNIGYMDLAGNCRFSFWPVYIKTVCERNPFAETRQLRSLYSPNSIKTAMILRVLLEYPKRVWRTQQLAVEAVTSLGQVASVKKQLEEREWLQSDAEGFRLTDAAALLSEWSKNYDTRHNHIRDFYSLKSVPEIETELAEFCSREGIMYALTGIAGGARYAPAVRYQRTTAYIGDEAIDRVADALDLKEVPTGPNVRLIEPYDQNVFYGSLLVKSAWIASPTQLYLDLRNTPGRGEEAAEALLRKEIEPKWR